MSFHTGSRNAAQHFRTEKKTEQKGYWTSKENFLETSRIPSLDLSFSLTTDASTPNRLAERVSARDEQDASGLHLPNSLRVLREAPRDLRAAEDPRPVSPRLRRRPDLPLPRRREPPHLLPPRGRVGRRGRRLRLLRQRPSEPVRVSGSRRVPSQWKMLGERLSLRPSEW